MIQEAKRPAQRIVPSGMTCMAARHWQWLAQTVLQCKQCYTYHANRAHHAKVPADDARSLEAYQLYQAAARKRPRVASPAVNANIESAAIESEL